MNMAPRKNFNVKYNNFTSTPTSSQKLRFSPLEQFNYWVLENKDGRIPSSNFTCDLSPTIVPTVDSCFLGKFNAHLHVEAQVDSSLET